MKIAVTYDNGNIFGHFGHTERFKVYTIEDGAVLGAEILNPVGSGHGALAGFLQENGVDAVICGGIGQGAVEALEGMKIAVFPGVEGNADDAVEAFLRGELTVSGANCDHHAHGEDEGGCHCENDACETGGCSGCAGCHAAPAIEGKNVGRKVKAHYRGTFNDGTEFDSSYSRGEPLEFICGAGQMIRGFDAAVATMDVGEVRDVHLSPAEAYGEKDPNAVFTVPLEMLPGAEELEVGERVWLQGANGQSFPAQVVNKDGATITFDANHEMAGRELNFRIELVEAE